MRDYARYSSGQLSAVCSNLAKACEKMVKDEEATLFWQLANYFMEQSPPIASGELAHLKSQLEEDLTQRIPNLEHQAKECHDRATLRALTWGKKVATLQKSLLGRFEKQQEQLLSNNQLYICEACGFIALADSPPAVCPICKAPSQRFSQVK